MEEEKKQIIRRTSEELKVDYAKEIEELEQKKLAVEEKFKVECEKLREACDKTLNRYDAKIKQLKDKIDAIENPKKPKPVTNREVDERIKGLRASGLLDNAEVLKFLAKLEAKAKKEKEEAKTENETSED